MLAHFLVEGNIYLVNAISEWVKVAITGRKIAPNTGANATKFFTLATKS